MFMKRLFFLFVVLLIVCIAFLNVFAGNYTVTLSTYDVVGSTHDFTTGGYPNIAAGAVIDKLTFSQVGGTAQTISCYDTATSTIAASLCATFSLSITTGVVQFDYPFYNPLTVRNLAVKKSATTSTVYMNIQYR